MCRNLALWGWLAFILVVSTASAKTTAVKISFIPTWGDNQLVLDSTYINDVGDTFSVALIHFYFSNISLGSNTKQTSALPVKLFMAEDTSSWNTTINAPFYSADTLYFSVGVDSTINVSGANEGDLDPMKRMYWAWNSGYIMAKVEGTCNRCNTLHHAFEYHIGGYQSPFNALRKVSLPLPQSKKSQISKGALVVSINMKEWLSNGFALHEHCSILIPGKDAMDMADRYRKIFTIKP